ncbi:hypothetical protein [Bradyrhizobium yuanmingense]|uniref:hypothetical protein n=1 Tax=Bradyrhizobium yuanmingense TaxID=108015 RepID=UPI0023B9A8E8|nr:hypothetical protein [Bradyrhizobium yuanmingense]MDF0498932.1 hypothetical protein [Bradyrhizobium yuanmingense]
MTVKNIVEPGSTLLQVVQQVQQLSAHVRRTLNSSGPGSLGHSSPDASAPAPRPALGSGGAEWELVKVTADLRDEIEHLAARQAASDVVLTEVIVPLLVAVGPDLASELVREIRSGLNVRTPAHDERLQLMTEGYLQRSADGIEARIRAKIAGA